MRAIIKDQRLYEEPQGDAPPPWWIRAILFLTCSAVSFFHGSNDGQKGVGLIMLILIGIVPARFALNTNFTETDVRTTAAAVRRMETTVRADASAADLADRLGALGAQLESAPNLQSLPADQRSALRGDVLRADDALGKYLKSPGAAALPADAQAALKAGRGQMIKLTDFVVGWVPLAVALALGVGTTIGWKRIVVTVGEKIGKTHLTYAQGAAAELIAAATIGLAVRFGLPVSTTHVLSSGVAGTMAANRSGLQGGTVRNIALAWVLTLPATMLIAGLLFALTAGGLLRDVAPEATEKTPPAQQRVRPEAH